MASPVFGEGVLGDFPSPLFRGVRTGNGLTPIQMARIIHAQRNKPKRSFVSTLKHIGDEAVLDPALWAFDKLLRVNYAMAEGTRRAGEETKRREGTYSDWDPDLEDLQSFVEFGKGFWSGMKGESKTSFDDVMKQQGKLKGHGRLRGATGFLMDVAFDPTTYLTLGAGAVAKGGAKGALSASKAVLRDAPEGLTKRQASEQLKAVKESLQVLDEAGEPFSKQAQLGRIKENLLRKQAFGADISPAERIQLNLARRVAQDSLDQLPRQLEVGVRLPFGRAARVGTRVPLPHAETMARLPLAGKGVSVLGKAFIPGYGNREGHAAAMGRKHAGEELATTHMEVMRAQFSGLDNLSAAEQRKALHFFEKKGGVVKTEDGRYILNPKRIEEAKKAGLTDKHIGFAQAMQNVGEYLAKQHDEFGVEFAHLGDKGILYVPHIMRRTGGALTNRHRSILSERGFQKGRKGEYTVAQLHAMKQAGRLPKDVETDPLNLMAMHLRGVANKQADSALTKHIVDTHGVPNKLVDRAAVSGLEKQLEELGQRIGAHPAQSLDEAQEIQKIIREASEETKALLRQKKADRTAMIQDFLENRPWTKTSMATITRLSRQNSELGKMLRRELESIRKLENPKVAKAVAQRRKEIAEARKELKELNTQLRKMEAELNKARKGKPNAAAKDLVKVDGITDEFGHPISVPKEIADSVVRMKSMIEADDEMLEKFAVGYRKWLGKWKLGVTSVNPGYHTRNTLSDFWNMWLAGMSVPAMVFYGGKAAKLMRQAKKELKRPPTEKKPALAEITDAYHHGVLSGLYQGDVQDIAYHLTHDRTKAAYLRSGKGIKLTAKVMQDINRNRENWGRMTHYLWRRQHHGMGIAESAKWVRAAHFDYEELTPFEQRRMKSWAPFYTWSRKNIPYQLQAVVGAPGRMATFPKAASALEGDAGEGQILPEHMQKGMYIRLPNGKYIAPMVGVTDLAKVNPMNWRDTTAGLLTPAFKFPAELLTNTSMLTGRPIKDPEGHPRNPVNDKLADVLSLLPGSNVGTTARGGVQGAGIDPRWSHIFSQLPATNALINNTGEIRNSQYGGNAKALAYLTGINQVEVDPEMQATIALLEEDRAFRGFLKGLRDEGLIPPAERRKKSKNEKLIEDILLQTLEGR